MAKIEALPGRKWGADAALKSAMEELGPDDQVLILGVVNNADGTKQRVFRSANMTQGEALFELERKKLDLFIDLDQEA
jgi:hypothetical protein